MKICFASNNVHKVAEMRALLEPGFEVLSLSDIGCHEELPETQETIEGNSRQKAMYVVENYHVPCFADDTGLEVTALNNEPGVYSARYAGDQKNSDDNIALLLARLNGKADRSARFRTVITLAGLSSTQTFEGLLPGTITKEKRGSGGFGYDPVFLPDGSPLTLAEMSLADKNKISHRARAVAGLVKWLRENRNSIQGNFGG